MIFIKQIRNANHIEWGICDECYDAGSFHILCEYCLERRNQYSLEQINQVKNSWEYRLRSWLSNWLKPSIEFLPSWTKKN